LRGDQSKEEHRHPGAGRDPDSTSVGFVLWIPACAGMTNQSKAEGFSSSRAQRSNLFGKYQALVDCFVTSFLAMTCSQDDS